MQHGPFHLGGPVTVVLHYSPPLSRVYVGFAFDTRCRKSVDHRFLNGTKTAMPPHAYSLTLNAKELAMFGVRSVGRHVACFYVDGKRVARHALHLK